MMREPIWEALFALVSASASYNTASRRWKIWSDLNAPDFPAIYQVEKRESAVYAGNSMPPKRSLFADLVIYANQPDVNLPPSSLLNPLLDAIETALEPDPITNRQTLGGLVQHCRIAGSTEITEGVIGGVAVAIVPIEILLP